MTIKEITKMLHQYGKQLESGNISEDELVTMTDLGRDLYERLVVLRHKAYEHMVNEEENATKAEAEKEALVASEKELLEDEVESTNQVEEPQVDEEPRPVIPIGSADVSPNQISLIDSIEEIKQMEQSINDRFKEQVGEKSLAQTLKQKPLEDLTTSIGINLKFRFISELFNEDKDAYGSSIDRLNSFNSYIEADEYIHNTLSEQYGWDEKDPLVKELVELTKRRYL
jgi:hypothetical protein